MMNQDQGKKSSKYLLKMVALFLKKHRSLLVIFLIVCLSHLFLFSFSFREPIIVNKQKKPLLIRTYQLNSSSPTSTKKNPTLQSKHRKARKRYALHPTTKITPSKKREEPTHATFLKQIKPSASISIPKAISSLEIDKNPLREEENSLLISYLRTQLTLPEYGSVTVKMTISRGKVMQMKILYSESDANSCYLKSHLPLIPFSWLDRGEEITLTLTFCNET